MKPQDVMALNDEELQAELDRLRRHVFDLRAQSVTEKLESPAMLQRAKHDIARLLTEKRKREMASAGRPANQPARKRS